jgi:abortive infection bacteriophage resistance protein
LTFSGSVLRSTATTPATPLNDAHQAGFLFSQAPMRTFTKPALSVDQQLSLLASRGLVISDQARAKIVLQKIGYYRFSAYTLPFEEAGKARTHKFRPGVRFEEVLETYEFDRQLRQITLAGMEVIEIALRVSITDVMSTDLGSHWFLNGASFDKGVAPDGVLQRIKDEIGHDSAKAPRRSVAIRHYYATYDNPPVPPFWMIAEVLPFGTTSRLYADLAAPHRKGIARSFGVHESMLRSWLHAMSYTRNVCAHHARLWNRTFTVRPSIGRQIEPFMDQKNGAIANDRFYAQALVLRSLLWALGEHGEFIRRVRLLTNGRGREERQMGFPNDWRDMEPWAPV